MIQIQQISPELLARYACVSIGFEVRSILCVDLIDCGFGGVQMVEEPVDHPYWRDYDVDERPTDWPGQFDLKNWTFFLAVDEDNQPVGAAAVAWNTPIVHMLEGREDLAVLWDIRVSPDFRGKGVGPLLFRAAEEWAQARGCRYLKIETQNINVPACRFYVRMGCVLGGLNRHAYRGAYANETMLLWYKEL
jgi:ribosomal protein S18 acetylase RimI-like enzyme